MAAPLHELLRAAGEPTRLRILNLLRRRDFCVCDLRAVLDLPQSTVSRHLAALRHASLVADRRAGNRVVYSLASCDALPIQALRRLLAECCPTEETLRADEARFRRVFAQSECCAPSEAQGETS